MTLRYSGPASLRSTLYNSQYSRYNYTSEPVAIDGLSASLWVGYDGETGKYYVGFSGTSPIYLSDGRIEVRSSAAGAILFRLDLGEGLFPPRGEGRLGPHPGQAAPAHTSVHVVVDLQNMPAQSVAVFRKLEQERTKFASIASTTLIERVPGNVCLRFPRSNKQLWTSEAFLKQSSSYFRQLLASGFAEANTKHRDEQQPVRDLSAYTFEESDEETDKLDPKGTKSKSEFDLPFKSITIKDTAYSTYFVVLVWLQSHRIVFAPLLSAFRDSGKTRQEALSTRSKSVDGLGKKASTTLPPPVSPKSVYRLSHLLELQSLSSLALDNLNSQLTPSNAAYELYSDVATCYPAVREVVLDFVVEKWSEVKGEASLKEMEDKAICEELSGGAAATAMMLARRLAEKSKA